jgi:hypothetical protein
MAPLEESDLEPRKTGTADLLVAVIAVVMGALGLCSGGFGVCGGAINVMSQSALTDLTMAGLSPEARAAYTDLMAATQLTQALGMGLALVTLGVSVLLLVSGTIALKSKQQQVSLLATALVVCIVHDVLKAMLTVFNLVWIQEPMARYMEASMAPIGVDIPIQGIAQLSMGIGLVLSLGWIALCMAFYIWGYFTLTAADEEDELLA